MREAKPKENLSAEEPFGRSLRELIQPSIEEIWCLADANLRIRLSALRASL